MPDNREALRECELCDNADFRPGVVCQVPAAGEGAGGAGDQPDPAVEALVRQIAEQILKQLGGK